jgi:hypothetical protein
MTVKKRKTIDYNYHESLINYVNLSILHHINKVLFSLDFVDISISINTPNKIFLKELGKHIHFRSKIPEKYTSNPIWKDLFRTRNYYELYPGVLGWVLTGKVRPLRNIDVLIRIPHPPPASLIKIEKILDRMSCIKDYGVSKLEPTLDIVIEKPQDRDVLQKLFKQTMQLKYGRDAFDQGEDEVTDYINFRTSVKQSRVYQKYVDDDDDAYESLRFELPVKRKKLFAHEIIKPTDILLYDLRIIDEIGFYIVDEVKLKRSLLDYDTDHYFSELIANFINNRGFHSAQLWARRIKECPKRCDFREKKSCRLMPYKIKVKRRGERFQAIQKCKHAKPIANFKYRYCKEIKELYELKYMMFKAFETWKKS